MSAVRLIGRRGVLAGAAACALALAGAGSAYAEALVPWWTATSGAQPTNLQSGVAKDAVQRLTISATKGDVLLIEPRRLNFETFEPLLYAVVPYNASAELMQKELEKVYPTKKVLVTGGPGDEGGTKPYVITFPGQKVGEPLFASGSLATIFGGEALSGGRAEASVAMVSEGASAGAIVVAADNLGDGAANGETTPVRIVDKLPPGLEAVGIEAVSGENIEVSDGPVECSLQSLTCTFSHSLPPYQQIEVRISVEPQPGASSGEANTATVSGGGAASSKTSSHPIEVDGRTRFGIDEYQLVPENVGGSIDTQAGSHPFQITSILTLDSQTPDKEGRPRTVALPRDLVGELPTGLVGNPTPFAQCTDAQFSKTSSEHPKSGNVNECPAQSAVGVATVTFNEPLVVGLVTTVDPLFNMQPLPGEPARFAFKPLGLVPEFLDTSIRTGGDYGVTISSHNITQIPWLLGVKLTFWGVPGDPRHDSNRGWECIYHFGTCTPSTAEHPPPFLIMPTSCGQPFQTTLHADSWGSGEKSSEQAEPFTSRLPEALDGCDHLNFAPSISVAPDVSNGSAPTGLTVGVHVPQAASLNPAGLAEAEVKDTTVALPQGVAINPAGADGLLSCSLEQIALESPGVPSCPDASKVGTVEIKTPLLANQLTGAAYLAAQNLNPFGSLVALYVVAEDPVSGSLVKFAGEVAPDPVTGQLVSTFKNTPQLPFEDFKLHFFGGSRAPLGTPALCGSYMTTASIAPWSGNPPSTPSSTFQISSGPNGSPCRDPLPFAPSLTAGTTSIQAGGFSPFTMTMSREDGNQNLNSIQLRMPPGLMGTLSTVKLCGEEQANAGTCGPESLIGHTVVSVGLGGSPFSVSGGEVFITGPYKGAPYGLSIVNPAKAGPFDLGKVVVRAKIEVDQNNAQLTITTDETGPYKIPTILDGIPLQIKHVNVIIDRSNFTFNPTNCSPLAITGSLTSSEGATDALSVPFQATNCAVLAFKPQLTASTSGKTSRANGTSLTVKLGYPAGPFDANIARVKVELPKQLPSRLSTLQKACTAQAFQANPASCPAASIIGHATATTPVLPVPLSGPAYFVSHGGEAFPSLIIVLQGYGTTVHLVGSTFISKSGITSSTFKTIPDVPVGTFELTLPQGPFSALTANTDLCKTKNLAMPTEFVGQNGAEIHTSTKIAVTGCKPAIGVLHHTVKGRTATITVSVPSAGKLVATGAGLSRATAQAGSAGTVAVKIRLSSKEQRFLNRHPGRRLRVSVKLLFTPKHGSRLSSHVALLMR